ncbi:matrixin family metalloprotease [Streptomyces sp. TRM75561]|uniref:Matrixin family metalloprotease n=1 Tax=Streptomyces cellulosae TaxID=1968 RepID=A0ABW6JBZ4_STRCE|nr:matrixin family metalloprotease [Streptomyces sp. TRM75561]MDH3037321.1 matrixin family metalloprotease [Streptomyces sp. TRM75561]
MRNATRGWEVAGQYPRAIYKTIMAVALAMSLSAVGGAANAAVPGPDVCELAEGELSVQDLPAGSSVILCDAIGRTVTHDGTGVTVPEPGMTVSVDMLTADGEAHGFTLEVGTDGKVAYDLGDGVVDTSTDGYDRPGSSNPDPASDIPAEPDTVVDPADTAEGTEVADVDAAAAPSACSDGAYSTADRKEYGTYNWYVGDGGMPGGLSRTDAKWAFMDAINNITDSYNNCGYGDTVGAKQNYLSTTSREASVNSKGQCTGRDDLSVWDAGDLKSSAVATTCTYTWSMPGVKNDLREADVRFNTHDYDFTNKPTSSCSNKYDIRSVGTHEAGHIFGLGHVGSGHSNLTMYTNSFTCKTIARTLGKGDVLALRSIY